MILINVRRFDQYENQLLSMFTEQDAIKARYVVKYMIAYWYVNSLFLKSASKRQTSMINQHECSWRQHWLKKNVKTIPFADKSILSLRCHIYSVELMWKLVTGMWKSNITVPMGKQNMNINLWWILSNSHHYCFGISKDLQM